MQKLFLFIFGHLIMPCRIRRPVTRN